MSKELDELRKQVADVNADLKNQPTYGVVLLRKQLDEMNECIRKYGKYPVDDFTRGKYEEEQRKKREEEQRDRAYWGFFS